MAVIAELVCSCLGQRSVATALPVAPNKPKKVNVVPVTTGGIGPFTGTVPLIWSFQWSLINKHMKTNSTRQQ